MGWSAFCLEGFKLEGFEVWRGRSEWGLNKLNPLGRKKVWEKERRKKECV